MPRFIRSIAISSCVKSSQRLGKYRKRLTGTPPMVWLPSPRYDDVKTRTSCPALRRRVIVSTSHGVMISDSLRGYAVVMYRIFTAQTGLQPAASGQQVE